MKPYEKEIVLYDTSISGKTKASLFLAERKRLLLSFDEEFLCTIGTQNKNFLLIIMEKINYQNI